MKQLEILASEFTSPEANEMVQEAKSLIWKKDSIAKIMKFLGICRASNHYMENILSKLDDMIEETNQYIEDNQYNEALKMMKTLTHQNRHFYEFANICTYSICEAANSKDSEYVSTTIVEYSNRLSEVGERFRDIIDSSMEDTYNNFKIIEADFLIDMYLAKKRELEKDN